MTKDEVSDYLSDGRIARLSTVDGQKPPVWYLHDEKFFYVSTGTRTKKADNIKKNPNVSLIIDSTDDGFKHKCVIVEGQLELSEKDHPEMTRKIYSRYLGEAGLELPFAQKLLKSDQYVVKIKPSKILTCDYAKAIR